MQLKFFKYHGTGNDFVMIDNRQMQWVKPDTMTVKQLCDRRFGIGADGLILLQNLNGFDFEMVYFNSDGRKSSMCGNGGRCISRFAYDLGIQRDEYSFMAVDGAHSAKVNAEKVSLKMIDVPPARELNDAYFLDTGSPHHVYFSDHIEGDDFVAEAKSIRYSDHYSKHGVNVNKVKIEGEGYLRMRTYERGVEDETWSCGTGVTAAALVYAKAHSQRNRVVVKTRGGELEVSFKYIDGKFQDIWLTGPVSYVFKGEMKV